jgi:hypothetical protein
MNATLKSKAEYVMKITLKSEEAMMLALAVYLNTFLPYDGWIFWALFLTPDISLLGYAVNPGFGAVTYNTLHHKGLALFLYLGGALFSFELLQFIGLLLFGHSSFDRMFGYGLKYSADFHHTHLGMIGKKAKEHTTV